MTENRTPKRENRPVLQMPRDHAEILRIAPIGIATSIPDGRFVDVNPALARIFGYGSPEEMINAVGDIAAELYADPRDRERIMRLLDERDEVLNFECRFVRRDGSVFWASNNVRVIRDEHGDIACYQSFFSDITERMRVEEALRDSEIKYKRLAENSPAVVYQFRMAPDGGLSFPYISEALLPVTGIPPRDVMADASVLIDRIFPEDAEKIRKEILESAKIQGPYFTTFRIRKGEGYIWLESRSTRENLPDGGIVFEGFFLDITERKRERESLLKTQFAMDRASDSILWIDDEGCIVYANDSACASMGYTSEELTKMKVFDIDPDFPVEQWEQHKKEMRRRGAVTFESQHRTKDGRIFPVEISSNYFEFDDRFLACAFHRDITERKRAAEAMYRRLTYENLLSRISTMAVEAIDLCDFLNRSIVLMGESMDVSRSYLFEHRYETDIMDNTYEWCAEGVSPQKENLQELPSDVVPWWIETIKSGRNIRFTDVEDIPDESTKKILRSQEILSILAVPLFVDGCYYGFIGFDDCLEHRPWPQEDVDILVSISRIIAVVIERKQEEEKLKLERSQLLSVFDSIEEPIYVADTKTYEILFVNRALEKMLRKNAVGGICYRELQGRDSPCPFCTNEIILRRSPEAYQWEHRNPALGKTFSLYDRIIRWSDGRDVRLEFAIDITDRKRAEEELREREGVLKSLLETTPVGVGLLKDRVLKKVNKALCGMTGYSEEELLGITTEILYINEEEYERVGRELYGQMEREGLGVKEAVLKRRDGRPINVILSLSPVDPGDPSAGVCATIQDITEHKRTEEERRKLKAHLDRAQKLESIGTLAGGIAHDFNNLLMGIQGNASIMMLHFDPSSPHYERLTRIEEQVRSGADLTRQLLGFAQGGRYELVPTDMNDIVEKTALMFGRTKKELTIYKRYGRDLWTVEVDRTQMEQVFMNLFVNAWQAMPGGGGMFLETENILLDDEKALPLTLSPGKYVRIAVSDRGTGMDAKTRERIFDPFFTTKEMGRGTGLGLATVYGIVKGHGGSIEVSSEPGLGTTFEIYLPTTWKEVLKEEKPQWRIRGGTETILLVDDEETVLEVEKEMLAFLGYRVHSAGSGREAVAAYHEMSGGIDLVILDMIMPGMSGEETFNLIREIDPRQKVLLFSGYSADGNARMILEKGCNGFLQKPFRLNELAREIRAVLDMKDKPS